MSLYSLLYSCRQSSWTQNWGGWPLNPVSQLAAWAMKGHLSVPISTSEKNHRFFPKKCIIIDTYWAFKILKLGFFSEKCKVWEVAIHIFFSFVAFKLKVSFYFKRSPASFQETRDIKDFIISYWIYKLKYKIFIKIFNSLWCNSRIMDWVSK